MGNETFQNITNQDILDLDSECCVSADDFQELLASNNSTEHA